MYTEYEELKTLKCPLSTL